jgi:hypothetical protein
MEFPRFACAAIFPQSISGSVKLMQGFNSGGEFATIDMLASLWNYLAGTILPEAAGLAIVGAAVNYARKKPFIPLVFAALAFLSVTALWSCCQSERTRANESLSVPVGRGRSELAGRVRF